MGRTENCQGCVQAVLFTLPSPYGLLAGYFDVGCLNALFKKFHEILCRGVPFWPKEIWPKNLRNWLIANKLSLNVTKTEFMLIGSPQMIKSTSCSQPNILIENKRIQQVNQSKSLGITIDQHLSWKPNTENICKKNKIRNLSSTSCQTIYC